MGLFGGDSRTSVSNQYEYSSYTAGQEDVDGIALANASNVNIQVVDGGAFDLAGRTVDIVEHVNNNVLEFSAGAIQENSRAQGQALTFADKSQERAARQSLKAVDAVLEGQDNSYNFSAGVIQQTNKMLSDTYGQSLDAVDGARKDSLEFAGGAISALQNAFTESVDEIGEFNQSAIQKYISASASESQQTTDKFVKFGSYVLGALAVIAVAPSLIRYAK